MTWKNIQNIKALCSPNRVIDRYPMSENIQHHIVQTRQRIVDILEKKSQRKLIIIGPCSIHDPVAALEYGKRLVELKKKHQDKLEIVMRVYLEKPRTTLGWKGFVYDPYLDNTGCVNDGLLQARKLLLDLNALGLPTATEFLDFLLVPYISDLMSWATIGARTVESQVHRALASSLTIPIGFKNATDGNVEKAVQAILSSREAQTLCCISEQGENQFAQSMGNPFTHIVLRGGNKPNYYQEDIIQTERLLEQYHLEKNIMIDVSHGNSQKQFKKQIDVVDEICSFLSHKKQTIIGLMIESFLQEGHQSIDVLDKLEFGKSITDGCLGFEDTEKLLDDLVKYILL